MEDGADVAGIALIHLVLWILSLACLLQTVSNFVVAFDDGFRVST